jgi:hypothetical protein
MHFFRFGVTGRPLAPQRFIPCFVNLLRSWPRWSRAPRASSTGKRPPGGWEDARRPPRAQQKGTALLGRCSKKAARRRVREASRVLRLLARVATAKGVTQPQRLPVRLPLLPGAASLARRCRVLQRDGARSEARLGARGGANWALRSGRRPSILLGPPPLRWGKKWPARRYLSP